MTMVDPVADLYTRIRNASRAGKDTVDIPASKMKIGIVEILIKEGFIETFKVLEDDRQNVIRAKLKYRDNRRKQVITNIRQISKPGLRRYIASDEVPQVRGGSGIAIISTSQGILTDDECRQKKIGGELLCYVW